MPKPKKNGVGRNNPKPTDEGEEQNGVQDVDSSFITDDYTSMDSEPQPGSSNRGNPRLNTSDRQDPHERMRIRKEYSLMRQTAQANKAELTRPGSDGLHETLKRTDSLFKKVRETREAVMDSQMVVIISQMAKEQAQHLHTDLRVFEPFEYAEKLITLVGGNELPEEDRQKARLSRDGWIKLGEASQPFFRRSPALHCMFGTFDRGPPKQKLPGSRQARKPETASEKGPTQPKELKSFSDTERHEVTTVEVEKMLQVLQQLYESNGRLPICYFEFIINPHSFGLTVENMFYASFLVRDGLARVFLDEDKLPVIEPVVKDDTAELLRRSERHQVVMTLNMDEYKEIVKAFNIREPLIKPRNNGGGGGGGGGGSSGGGSAKKPKNR